MKIIKLSYLYNCILSCVFCLSTTNLAASPYDYESQIDYMKDSKIINTRQLDKILKDDYGNNNISPIHDFKNDFVPGNVSFWDVYVTVKPWLELVLLKKSKKEGVRTFHCTNENKTSLQDCDKLPSIRDDRNN